MVKFDCLSRSIRHFCEIYETYFKDGSNELVATREAIRLDSALGRALINILLVFAQMEREATDERTREAIRLRDQHLLGSAWRPRDGRQQEADRCRRPSVDRRHSSFASGRSPAEFGLDADQSVLGLRR